MTTLACPSCGDHGDLRTVESIIGTCNLDSVSVEDGDLVLDHCGYTEVHWDTSTSTGLECGCGWSASGKTTAKWLSQLVPYVEDEDDEEEDPSPDAISASVVRDLLVKAHDAGRFSTGSSTNAEDYAEHLLREVGK